MCITGAFPSGALVERRKEEAALGCTDDTCDARVYANHIQGVSCVPYAIHEDFRQKRNLWPITSRTCRWCLLRVHVQKHKQYLRKPSHAP